MNANDPRHGTKNGYGNLKCRCDRCREAHTEYLWRGRYGTYERDRCPGCGGEKDTRARRCRGCWKHDRKPTCGDLAMYRRGCRCDLCRAASTADKRQWRERKAAAA